MASATAPEAAHCHLEVAPFNPNRFAVEQGIRQLFPRGSQHPVESGAGYLHPLGTLLLLQSFHILEADRLRLLD